MSSNTKPGRRRKTVNAVIPEINPDKPKRGRPRSKSKELTPASIESRSSKGSSRRQRRAMHDEVNIKSFMNAKTNHINEWLDDQNRFIDRNLTRKSLESVKNNSQNLENSSQTSSSKQASETTEDDIEVDEEVNEKISENSSDNHVINSNNNNMTELIEQRTVIKRKTTKEKINNYINDKPHLTIPTRKKFLILNFQFIKSNLYKMIFFFKEKISFLLSCFKSLFIHSFHISEAFFLSFIIFCISFNLLYSQCPHKSESFSSLAFKTLDRPNRGLNMHSNLYPSFLYNAFFHIYQFVLQYTLLFVTNSDNKRGLLNLLFSSLLFLISSFFQPVLLTSVYEKIHALLVVSLVNSLSLPIIFKLKSFLYNNKNINIDKTKEDINQTLISTTFSIDPNKSNNYCDGFGCYSDNEIGNGEKVTLIKKVSHKINHPETSDFILDSTTLRTFFTVNCGLVNWWIIILTFLVHSSSSSPITLFSSFSSLHSFVSSSPYQFNFWLAGVMQLLFILSTSMFQSNKRFRPLSIPPLPSSSSSESSSSSSSILSLFHFTIETISFTPYIFPLIMSSCYHCQNENINNNNYNIFYFFFSSVLFVFGFVGNILVKKMESKKLTNQRIELVSKLNLIFEFLMICSWTFINGFGSLSLPIISVYLYLLLSRSTSPSLTSLQCVAKYSPILLHDSIFSFFKRSN